MAIPSLAMIPSGYRATNLYSVLPTDGVGDFTVARASTATRVNSAGLIETMAANVPRLDYSDGGCPVLLTEPQSTNLITYSEDFSGESWSKSRATITSNQIISPDGTLNADLLTITDTPENYVQTNVSLSVSGAKQTVSCFIKKGTNNFAHFLLWDSSSNGCRQWFDLENETVESSTSFGSGISFDSASIENYGNGWVRCIVVFNCSLTSVRVRIAASNGDGQTDGTIGKTIYIWGYQCEGNSSYATSYIPNYGTALGVTRVADVVTDAGDVSTFNDSEGVLYAEISALADDGTYRFISLSDGTLSNRVSLFLSNTNTLNGSANGVSSIASVVDIKNNNKVAYKYKSGDYSLWANGFEVGTLTVTTGNHSNLNRLNFDYGQGSDDFYGKTKQLQYFDSALTDLELETLTSWQSFTDMAKNLKYTII